MRLFEKVLYLQVIKNCSHWASASEAGEVLKGSTAAWGRVLQNDLENVVLQDLTPSSIVIAEQGF